MYLWKLASYIASKLRRRRATEDMHVSGEAGPPRLFPTGLHSLLTPSLVLRAAVGRRTWEKKARWGWVGVSGMFWCVLLGVCVNGWC